MCRTIFICLAPAWHLCLRLSLQGCTATSPTFFHMAAKTF